MTVFNATSPFSLCKAMLMAKTQNRMKGLNFSGTVFSCVTITIIVCVATANILGDLQFDLLSAK